MGVRCVDSVAVNSFFPLQEYGFRCVSIAECLAKIVDVEIEFIVGKMWF